MTIYLIDMTTSTILESKKKELCFEDFLTDCEAYSTFDGNNPFDMEKMKFIWNWIITNFQPKDD